MVSGTEPEFHPRAPGMAPGPNRGIMRIIFAVVLAILSGIGMGYRVGYSSAVIDQLHANKPLRNYWQNGDDLAAPATRPTTMPVVLTAQRLPSR